MTGTTAENQPEVTRHYGNPDDQANQVERGGRQG